jgi:hypothetical protein
MIEENIVLTKKIDRDQSKPMNRGLTDMKKIKFLIEKTAEDVVFTNHTIYLPSIKRYFIFNKKEELVSLQEDYDPNAPKEVKDEPESKSI